MKTAPPTRKAGLPRCRALLAVCSLGGRVCFAGSRGRIGNGLRSADGAAAHSVLGDLPLGHQLAEEAFVLLGFDHAVSSLVDCGPAVKRVSHCGSRDYGQSRRSDDRVSKHFPLLP